MHEQYSRFRTFAFATLVAIMAFSGSASADPPSRVARLGYMTGAVSLSPAGEIDWVQATINRPLTTGDRLWTDAGARAEVQVGGAMIRMTAGTAVSVLNLDDQIAQLQLTQGAMNVRVRRLEPDQVFEVDTPNLAFTLRQPGAYRIEVDPEGNATTIYVRSGQGEVYGEDASYVIDARQPYRFIGTGLREYEVVNAQRYDEFDRWSSDRDLRYDNSPSARYVSQDVVGYQDLDASGTWRVDPSYGNVWIPNRVAADWAPYRDGHWAWVDPWGWTWVDDAPWGFAVSHYGRWANLGGTWGWVPGPVRSRAYYAPALVAFVGGSNFQVAISSGNVGGIAWFPLGPRDVYRPSYPVSRGYFESVNRSNTVINNTVINNYYNNTNVSNVTYMNRQVPGAVIAVPATAFVQSQPVNRAIVQVSREMASSAAVAFAPTVAPTEKSVRGAAAQGDKPPARVFERPVIARTAPPAAHAGFAAQQQQLTAKPGQPLDDAARRELKPAAAPAQAPVIKVVAPTQKAPPTARLPDAASAARPGDARGKSEERKAPAISGAPAAPGASAPVVPGAPVQGNAAPQASQPPSAAQPADTRWRPEQRGKGEQRGQPPEGSQGASPAQGALPQVNPSAPPKSVNQTQTPAAQPQIKPPPSPNAVPPAPAAVPQPVPPAPAAQTDPRWRPEQRNKGDQSGQQPMAAPTSPPPRPAAAIASPPQGVPPAAAVQKPAQVAIPPQPVPPAAAMQKPAPAPKPEPMPAAKQAEPQPRPAAAVPRTPPPQPQPAPAAEPRGQEQKGAAEKAKDKKKDADEQKREEEKRKKEGG